MNSLCPFVYEDPECAFVYEDPEGTMRLTKEGDDFLNALYLLILCFLVFSYVNMKMTL